MILPQSGKTVRRLAWFRAEDGKTRPSLDREPRIEPQPTFQSRQCLKQRRPSTQKSPVSTTESAGAPTLGVVPTPLMQNVPVQLKDLDLKVTRGYRDPPQSLVRFSDTKQSSPSIALAFTMKPGVNVVNLLRN